MLSFTLSAHAYLKRLFMAFLILPCLVVAEQAQQPLGGDHASEAGMSVAEHYTLSGDSLRLRHSRELDVGTGHSSPDMDMLHVQLLVAANPLQAVKPARHPDLALATGSHALVLARGPPAL